MAMIVYLLGIFPVSTVHSHRFSQEKCLTQSQMYLQANRDTTDPQSKLSFPDYAVGCRSSTAPSQARSLNTAAKLLVLTASPGRVFPSTDLGSRDGSGLWQGCHCY